MSATFGDALSAEIARVTKILTLYRDPYLKGAGEKAALMTEADLDNAVKALASGDVVRIRRAYHTLKDITP